MLILHALLTSASMIVTAPPACTPPLPPALEREFEQGRTGAKAWLYMHDKALTGAELNRAVAGLAETMDSRAVRRRALRAVSPSLFDERDLPVAPAYVGAIAGTGVRVRVESRWLNAVSVEGTRDQLVRAAALPFVERAEAVRSARRAGPLEPEAAGAPYTPRGLYGLSGTQLAQINLPALHAEGFTGQGVIIGILDTGFRRDHEAFNQPGMILQVVAEHDFINNDANTGIDDGDDPEQHRHGTLILGCIGANYPGNLVGGAYQASFVLCKTENVTSETPVEEDFYVAGIEFIESHGGDLATSSLSYSDWYTQADMNGVTAPTSIAVNMATLNGLHCCTAAGNAGHDDDPGTSRLGAPADALRVLTCGAVATDGVIAGFSSDGPTADGRVKPELLACGVSTQTVRTLSTSGFTSASGTSLSTPLVAAAVACLTQKHPDWTTDQMRAALFATATDAVANNGAFDPLYVRGYGILDAAAAGAFGSCDADYNMDGGADTADIIDLSNDIASGTQSYPPNSPDFNGDGGADTADVLDLANVVAGGACP